MPYDMEAVLRMAAEADRQKPAEAVPPGTEERIVWLPVDALVDFPAEKHKFQPAAGQRLTDLEESVRQYGILNPLLVRPLEDGQYQIIAGHNRRTAARNIGWKKVPCIRKDLADDDEALGILVTDNLQHRELLPSERGWAYRDLMDIRRRQGQRTDLTLCKVGTRSRSDESIAADFGGSARTVQRFIRLTYLIPELLELVDQKKLGLVVGEQLSYLSVPSQELVYLCRYAVEKPRPLKESHARTLREVEADPDRSLDEALLEELLAPQKKARLRTLKIEMSKLRDYFPAGTPEGVITQTIQTALAIYFEERR